MTCTYEGCEEPSTTTGLCKRHRRNAYMREYAQRSDRPLCSVEGCDRSCYGRASFCEMHYQRVRTTGDPGPGHRVGLQRVSLSERFWAHVDRRSPDECWPWTGAVDSDGYGAIRAWAKSNVKAHRVAWVLAGRGLTPGLTLDHTCHSRAVLVGACAGGRSCPHRCCVNPAHLEQVTHAENTARGQRAQTDVCMRGHDLTDPANLKPNKRGVRQCRACVRLARSDRYRRLGR